MIQSLTKKILNTNGQIKAASSICRLGLYYPKKIRYISPMGIEFHSLPVYQNKQCYQTHQQAIRH